MPQKTVWIPYPTGNTLRMNKSHKVKSVKTEFCFGLRLRIVNENKTAHELHRDKNRVKIENCNSVSTIRASPGRTFKVHVYFIRCSVLCMGCTRVASFDRVRGHSPRGLSNNLFV